MANWEEYHSLNHQLYFELHHEQPSERFKIPHPVIRSTYDKVFQGISNLPSQQGVVILIIQSRLWKGTCSHLLWSAPHLYIKGSTAMLRK